MTVDNSLIRNVQGFKEEELEYYSRQIVLTDIGLKGQLKLKNSKVCIVGLGGLGSPSAIQLATMGVGYIRLVDRDVVEMSNLQRQHLYSVNMVGYPKVEAAEYRLRGLNPYIEIEPLPTSLNANNAEDILRGVDVVIDGLDHMVPRYAVNRACIRLGIPYVFGAAITNVGNLSTIVPGATPCLECFFVNVDDRNMPSCAVVGVNPSIINIVASIQTSETIRLLLGRQPNLVNTLLFCNLDDLTFEKIELAKNEGCPVCGKTTQIKPSPLNTEFVEEVCGREGRRVFVITPVNNVDLNLSVIDERLKQLRYNINTRARLGRTFSNKIGVKGSILTSGVAIIEGVKGKEEAKRLFNKILQ
jgi:adenylyltransferase/sulfurtransferase